MKKVANPDYLEMIRCATKAPSGHNTQPWRFRCEENAILVKPNLEVALPVVDSDNRELYISLGCALENIFLAASHWGYDCRVISCDEKAIKVELTKREQTVENPLYDQIEKRQNNRSLYQGRKIADGPLKKLQSLETLGNIHLYFAEVGGSMAQTLTQHIVQGNQQQMNDPAFRQELLSWMRFNSHQVESRGDGLSYKVFGNPALPRLFAKVIVRQFLRAGQQNKSDVKKIKSSSHLVLFTTKHNSIEEWIDLGRVLQRFCLVATELGISSAFCNPACEVESLAKSLQKELALPDEHPSLLLRIGYADPRPFSPRKKLEEVIEE